MHSSPRTRDRSRVFDRGRPWPKLAFRPGIPVQCWFLPVRSGRWSSAGFAAVLGHRSASHETTCSRVPCFARRGRKRGGCARKTFAPASSPTPLGRISVCELVKQGAGLLARLTCASVMNVVFHVPWTRVFFSVFLLWSCGLSTLDYERARLVRKQASDVSVSVSSCLRRQCKEHDKRRGKKTCNLLAICCFFSNANKGTSVCCKVHTLHVCVCIFARYASFLKVVNWLILPVSNACLKD